MRPDDQGNGGALIDQPEIRELLTKPTADLSEEERERRDLLRQVLSSVEDTRSDLTTGQERIEEKVDPEELGANLARELANQATQQSGQGSADRNERGEQFKRFVRSSTLGGIALLVLFGSLFAQGAVSAAIAVPVLALLVIIIAGFGGAWHDTS